MSFDSLSYLFFLPIVYAIYLLLNRGWQNALLVLASYVFYGWWDVRFLFLILVSTAVDYCCGLLIERDKIQRIEFARAAVGVAAGLCCFVLGPELYNALTTGLPVSNEVIWASLCTVGLAVTAVVGHNALQRASIETRRKAYLLTSITVNLGILGFFKYFDFFVSSAEAAALSLGMENVSLLHLDIVLPVGISFYTFQTLSYSIGVYRGETKPTTDYVAFSLFVAFFPQLVAGPIERASRLLPVLLKKREVTLDWIQKGLFLILLGLFKKVGIANGMAGSVDSIYNTTGTVSSLDILLATLCFAVQIYCDFSGYSDIARGSSKLFGIDLMRNFEQPYFSKNPSEFWRRWHISLSSWLRDYLYISLGGNRVGQNKLYRNLMLTMLLGGLWHGAAWNFVLWGAYQGGILIVHRLLTQSKNWFTRLTGAVPQVLVIIAFFFVVCYGWLLFRATSLEQILDFTRILFFEFEFDFDVSIKRPTFAAAVGLPLLFLLDASCYRTDNVYLRNNAQFVKGAALAMMLVVLLMGMSSAPTQFIYFQF